MEAAIDLDDVPPYHRARVIELLERKPKFGVKLCKFCQVPFVPKRPWAKWCQPSHRVTYYNAYHPRGPRNVEHGRRVRAEHILKLVRE